MSQDELYEAIKAHPEGVLMNELTQGLDIHPGTAKEQVRKLEKWGRIRRETVNTSTATRSTTFRLFAVTDGEYKMNTIE